MPSGGSAKGNARRHAAKNTKQPITRGGVMRNIEESLDSRLGSSFSVWRTSGQMHKKDAGTLGFCELIRIACHPTKNLSKEAWHLFTMLKRAQEDKKEEEFCDWLQINRVGDDGRTALWYAAFNGFTDVVKAFHAVGADLELVDAGPGMTNGATPLQAAACRKHHETVCALLQLGARPNYQMLIDIIRVSTIPILRELVAAGMDVNTSWYNEQGIQIFPLTAAARDNRVDMIEELVRLGARVHEPKNSSSNVLATSVARTNSKTMAVLIEMGFDVNKPHGCPPLMVAFETGNVDAASEIMKKRACYLGKRTTHVNVHTAFRAAIEQDCQIAFLALLPSVCARDSVCCVGCEKCRADDPVVVALNRPEVNCTSDVYTVHRSNGRLSIGHETRCSTAEWDSSEVGCCAPPHFILAVSLGRLSMVDEMLKYGASPTICNPAIRAAGKGNVQILKMLINANADVKKTSKCGNFTCLKAACVDGQTEAVAFLHELGLDLDASDTDGKTGLHHAVHGGHVETVMKMVQLGARGLAVMLANAAKNNKWNTVHRLAHLVGTKWGNLALVHARELAMTELAKTRLRLYIYGSRQQRSNTQEIARIKKKHNEECARNADTWKCRLETQKTNLTMEHMGVMHGLENRVALAEAQSRSGKSALTDTRKKLKESMDNLERHVGALRSKQEHNTTLELEIQGLRSEITASKGAYETVHRELENLKHEHSQQKRSMHDDSECCICLAASKSWIFLPCRHMVVCGPCGAGIMQGGRVCPICRTHIAECVEVYS